MVYWNTRNVGTSYYHRTEPAEPRSFNAVNPRFNHICLALTVFWQRMRVEARIVKPKPPNPMRECPKIAAEEERGKEGYSLVCRCGACLTQQESSQSVRPSIEIRDRLQSAGLRSQRRKKRKRETMMNSDLGQEELRKESTVQCWSSVGWNRRCPSPFCCCRRLARVAQEVSVERGKGQWIDPS